jgi:homoserine/homoserine lactone efflux protein
MDAIINLNLWAAFVVASAALALLPGPIVTLVIANSLRHGTRAGAANVLGTLCGNAVLFSIGGLGMAWVLSALAEWFDLLRWAGVAYLVFLGVKQWFARADGLEDQAAAAPGHSLFWQGAVVAITNPKTIIFYAAFLPQFMDPTLPAAGQLIVLSATFLIVAGSLDMTYAVLAGRLRPLLTGARRGRIRNKITGALLTTTGVALAVTNRP